MKRSHFRVEVEGHGDITAVIADRLLELTVTDVDEVQSDTMAIVLDNRDDKIAFPATGVSLRIWMGQEGALVDKGRFTIDEISEGIEGGDLEITGKAADMTGGIKATKTHTWEAPLTLEGLLSEIAARNGYSCKVHPDIRGVSIGHINQRAESDMNLATRICKAHGAVMKVGGGVLMAVPTDSAENADGVSLGVCVIDDPSESTGRVTIQERGTFSAVQASYFDPELQTVVNVVVGKKGGQTSTIKGRSKNAEEATAKAMSALAAHKRGRATMSLERPLSPEIVSPGRVRVVNHRRSANGLWKVKSATHTIGSGGVGTTSLSLETVEHAASSGR